MTCLSFHSIRSLFRFLMCLSQKSSLFSENKLIFKSHWLMRCPLFTEASEGVVFIFVCNEPVSFLVIPPLFEKKPECLRSIIRKQRCRIILSPICPDPARMDTKNIDSRIIFRCVIECHCAHVDGSFRHSIIQIIRAITSCDTPRFRTDIYYKGHSLFLLKQLVKCLHDSHSSERRDIKCFRYRIHVRMKKILFHSQSGQDSIIQRDGP